MILVTGANGLVGSFLCKEFIQKGYRVRALVRKNSDCTLLNEIADKIEIFIGDINDTGSLIDAVEGVESIVHAAAIISFWNKRKDEMYQTNVLGTKNIVDVALEKNIKRFIHISSIAAIGRKPKDLEIDETNTWEESSLNSPYAVTKHQAELEVFRGIEEGLKAIIVNPSVILGPGLKGTSSVRLFEYVEQKNKFYTEGYINYVDVRDLSEIILFLLNSDTPIGERYIVSGGLTSYRDFFDQIADKIQVPAPKVKAAAWMRQLAWRIEAIKSFFTGKEPLLTKNTAKTASNKFEYKSNKIIQRTGKTFRPLKDTIAWTCTWLFDK